MKKLTRKQAIKDSFIKWDHAAKTGVNEAKLKEWLKKKHRNIYNYYSECGLCEYYHIIIKVSCARCPLNNSLIPACIPGNDGYYMQWLDAKTPKTRKKYATLIRNVLRGLLV